MSRVCRVYIWLCKRVGPRIGSRRVPFSAWAWQRELDGRGYLLRELIDDAFLVWKSEEDHCQQQFQRETRVTHDATKGHAP